LLANLKLGQQGHDNVDAVPTVCALGPTLPNLQCAPWVRWPRRGTDHTILSSAEVIGLYIYSHTYLHGAHADNWAFFCKSNASAHTLFVRNYFTQLARMKIPTFTHQQSAGSIAGTDDLWPELSLRLAVLDMA